jgi:hypothetical protein
MRERIGRDFLYAAVVVVGELDTRSLNVKNERIEP